MPRAEQTPVSHALGQVAHFSTPATYRPEVYQRALNKLLPDDIVIRVADEVDPSFHARYNAVSKTYRYLILNRRTPSAMDRNRAWFYPFPLDVNAMIESLAMMTGTHNFGSFRATGSKTGSPVRTIINQKIEMSDNGLIAVNLCANGFLRHMVRNIVGTITEVGRGKITKTDFNAILLACDRTKAGPTAPPQGLYLVEVHY